jgi:hypothetical protein
VKKPFVQARSTGAQCAEEQVKTGLEKPDTKSQNLLDLPRQSGFHKDHSKNKVGARLE